MNDASPHSTHTLIAILAGCGATTARSPYTGDLRSQQGDGITVFGTLDFGLGTQHAR